jgi:hypothetical protein
MIDKSASTEMAKVILKRYHEGKFPLDGIGSSYNFRGSIPDFTFCIQLWKNCWWRCWGWGLEGTGWLLGGFWCRFGPGVGIALKRISRAFVKEASAATSLLSRITHSRFNIVTGVARSKFVTIAAIFTITVDLTFQALGYFIRAIRSI